MPASFFPPILDHDCGEGKTIDTFDIDALAVLGAFITDPSAAEGRL